MTVAIRRAETATGEVRALLQELDAALAGPYAADQQHGLSLDALFRPEVRFFVARLDDSAAGCGGVALLESYLPLRPQGRQAADLLCQRSPRRHPAERPQGLVDPKRSARRPSRLPHAAARRAGRVQMRQRRLPQASRQAGSAGWPT